MQWLFYENREDFATHLHLDLIRDKLMDSFPLRRKFCILKKLTFTVPGVLWLGKKVPAPTLFLISPESTIRMSVNEIIVNPLDSWKGPPPRPRAHHSQGTGPEVDCVLPVARGTAQRDSGSLPSHGPGLSVLGFPSDGRYCVSAAEEWRQQ